MKRIKQEQLTEDLIGNIKKLENDITELNIRQVIREIVLSELQQQPVVREGDVVVFTNFPISEREYTGTGVGLVTKAITSGINISYNDPFRSGTSTMATVPKRVKEIIGHEEMPERIHYPERTFEDREADILAILQKYE